MPEGKGTYGSKRGRPPRPKHKQGYNARLHEHLGSKDGAESTKTQSYTARDHESEGMEESMGKGKYAAVSTMDREGGTIHIVHVPTPLERLKKRYNEAVDEYYGDA